MRHSRLRRQPTLRSPSNYFIGKPTVRPLWAIASIVERRRRLESYLARGYARKFAIPGWRPSSFNHVLGDARLRDLGPGLSRSP
jgi:hypothetical protein